MINNCEAYDDMYQTVVHNGARALMASFQDGEAFIEAMDNKEFVDCVLFAMLTSMCAFLLCVAEDTEENEAGLATFLNGSISEAMRLGRETMPSFYKKGGH